MLAKHYERNILLQTLREKTQIGKENMDDKLKKLEQWSEESKIKFTPTIFINGNELPKQYKVNDLRVLIREISKTTIKVLDRVETNAE